MSRLVQDTGEGQAPLQPVPVNPVGTTPQSQSSPAVPKLCVDRVTKIFVSPKGDEEVVAMQELSLQAERHSFICLLGPSGCGKSTLLNLIAGFIQPTAGEIRVDGRTVSAAGADRGVVFQDYALFPWLSVQRNVEFGPRISGIARAGRSEIAAKYIAMVGLSDFAQRYPHELSGGMKQRVAIARALANRPTVLLLDEPFGALDAMTRETMQDELLNLTSREPKLVIFVTHSVLESVFLADRIIVMSARPGRILADVSVPLPHPRDRTAAAVTEYVREIRQVLDSELRSSSSLAAARSLR